MSKTKRRCIDNSVDGGRNKRNKPYKRNKNDWRFVTSSDESDDAMIIPTNKPSSRRKNDNHY